MQTWWPPVGFACCCHLANATDLLMPVLWTMAGHIFSCLWTKVHQIKFASVGVSIVCNTVFPMTMSCCIPEISVIKSLRCPKLCQNFCFWAAKFGAGGGGGRRGHPNCWPNFINLGQHRTCGKVWWRLDKRPRRLGGRKKKKERSKHQQQNIMACPHYRKGGHNYYNYCNYYNPFAISTQVQQFHCCRHFTTGYQAGRPSLKAGKLYHNHNNNATEKHKHICWPRPPPVWTSTALQTVSEDHAAPAPCLCVL